MDFTKIRTIILATSVTLISLHQAFGVDLDQATFTGTISRLSAVGEIMRIKLNMRNAKFLRKNDRVEFWTDMNRFSRCYGVVIGKTNDYLALRVPKFDDCTRRVGVRVGSTINFYSKDLKNNLVIVQELVEILNKKHLAISSKKQRSKIYLDTHMERVETVNKRYETLREKLELEWQKELSHLEEEKTKIFKDFKQAEADLNDIEMKLEAYRVHDKNYETNRWSLDPELYIRK